MNFNQIKSLFVKSTPVRTATSVDSILSTFTNTLNELTSVEQTKNVEAAEHTEQVVIRQRKAQEAAQEAQRAAVVKNKISALLSTEE